MGISKTPELILSLVNKTFSLFFIFKDLIFSVFKIESIQNFKELAFFISIESFEKENSKKGLVKDTS